MGSIGIFDSGLGGLTVVKEIFRHMPEEEIIYFGDTARVPYGSKSKETIIKYSLQIVRFLLEHNVKMIVVACNTSSSYALPILTKMLKIPVVDVIHPGIKAAIRLTKNGRIGVIGTEGTIRSGAYNVVLKKYSSDVKLFSQACPLLVPLVEEGWDNSYTQKRIVKLVVQEYLSKIKKTNIDTLILACTHYPLISKIISEVMGSKVRIVDSAKATVQEIKNLLNKKTSIISSKKAPQHRFYVSDISERFIMLSKKFAGTKTITLRKVDIEKY